MELVLAVIFILPFNFTGQAVRVLAFNPLSFLFLFFFFRSMTETTSWGSFNYALNNHVSIMIRAMHCLL